MKKLVAIILAIGLFSTMTANAYYFPEPDWGALLNERKNMVTSTDFELYVEGGPENAPYYGAKFEPRAGTMIGTVVENAETFFPASSNLSYIEFDNRQDYIYYDTAQYITKNDMVAEVGWNTYTLDNMDYDYARRTLEMLNSYNRPIYVRYANEMNCSNLGDDPDKYIDRFRNIANMTHEYPNLAVVWAPNDMGALDRPFQYYYPGDEYVDWVGVSCYVTKYFTNEVNTSYKDSVYFMTGDYGWTTNKLKPFMEFLKNYNINKPVMICEGGVARSNSFGDDYTGWHEPRLRNMLWNTIMKYPQIKMINYFNRGADGYGEHYGITGYSSSVDIFKEAESNGAYLRYASGSPDFVFTPANNGDTLAAKDGIVNLYTLAYIAQQPNISVNYKIDGVWYHSSNQIPYTCHFDINSVTDGKHTLTIEASGQSKTYTFYKNGQLMSFGQEPDMSKAQSASASENTPVVQSDKTYEQPAKEIKIVVQRGFDSRTESKAVKFEQSPVIVDGRTLAPMREVFQAMNMAVSWDDNTKTAKAAGGRTTLTITIGENKLYKSSSRDGDSVFDLEVPAMIINNKTMIPVRAIAESVGATVDWDGDTNTVTISGYYI